MIKTTLPAFESVLDEATQKVVIKEKQITVSIDTTLFAEQRWEQNFPANAKNETLFAYIERFKQNGLIDAAHILSCLKAFYCFLEGDEIADFKSFCQLFDAIDPPHLQRLVDKIKSVFEIVLNSATTDSKN